MSVTLTRMGINWPESSLERVTYWCNVPLVTLDNISIAQEIEILQ